MKKINHFEEQEKALKEFKDSLCKAWIPLLYPVIKFLRLELKDKYKKYLTTEKKRV
jgi:hypothetical protein